MTAVRVGLAFILLSWCLPLGIGAQPNDSTISPSRAWDPPERAAAGTAVRTGSGHPGPQYWQNHVDYNIHARLDTSAGHIQGTVTATYTNRSPTPLSSLWLLTGTPPSSAGPHEGSGSRIQVRSVTVAPKGDAYEPTTVSAGGRLQVRLRSPISAQGGTTTVKLEFVSSLRREGLPGTLNTGDGPIYGVGQWLPRVAVYTDQRGWASPRTGHRAGGEYGSFDYHLTVPAALIVAGSGTLMNPGEVLTGDQRRRLMRARDSRQKVAIITPDQAGHPDTRPAQSGTLTWHFRMNGVRTVAWAASPAFIWNAAAFRRPGERDGLAMSFYPPDAMGGAAWNRSTYHVQKAAEYFSTRVRAYPWNNAVNVAGPGDGAALPGLSLCPVGATGPALFTCSVRNQSRNWFPGMVGSPTARHPWMDGGMATAMTVLAHRHLYDGEFSDSGAALLSDGERSPARTLARRMQDPKRRPLLRPPAAATTGAVGTRPSHLQPAYGVLLLRDYVLTPERFDYALRQYAQRWAFRRATPWDLFRTFSDATGEDLSWFWHGWFATTWTIDVAVAEVSSPHPSPQQGARLTLRLKTPFPMPVRARIEEANGASRTIHLPADVWRDGPTETVQLDTDAPLQRVVVDPDGVVPDVQPADNSWSAGGNGEAHGGT